MSKSEHSRKREDPNEMSKTVHESSKMDAKEERSEEKAPMLP